jgi:hypothetical protein
MGGVAGVVEVVIALVGVAVPRVQAERKMFSWSRRGSCLIHLILQAAYCTRISPGAPPRCGRPSHGEQSERLSGLAGTLLSVDAL